MLSLRTGSRRPQTKQVKFSDPPHRFILRICLFLARDYLFPPRREPVLRLRWPDSFVWATASIGCWGRWLWIQEWGNKKWACVQVMNNFITRVSQLVQLCAWLVNTDRLKRSASDEWHARRRDSERNYFKYGDHSCKEGSFIAKGHECNVHWWNSRFQYFFRSSFPPKMFNNRRYSGRLCTTVTWNL